MKKKIWMVTAFVMGMAMSVTLTSCGDDDEPTPIQQNDDNGNGGNNGNDNGNGGNDQGGNGGSENDNPEYVDLGLPSGTLWATCNVGASKPEDYGDYFAWGETTGYNSGKTNFVWSTYKYNNANYLTKYCYYSSFGYNGFMDNLTELLPEDDAATANRGSEWRMPSYEQFNELINSSYTTTEWTTENGVKGRKITSKVSGYVGNYIFLPAAGYREDSSLNDAGSGGYYWSRTLLNTGTPYNANYLYFGSNYITCYDYDRCSGISVRPVRK